MTHPVSPNQPPRPDEPAPAGAWEPEPTRLPQHPRQDDAEPADEAPPPREPGESRAADATLPAPTEAD